MPEGVQTAKYQLAGYEGKGYETRRDQKCDDSCIRAFPVLLELNQEALNVNSDGTQDKWTVAEGSRAIYVGAASDDLSLNTTVEVKEKATQADLDKATAEAQAAKRRQRQLRRKRKKRRQRQRG